MNYKNQCIYLVRKELVNLYNSKKSFLDSAVLKKSQQLDELILDELINKYLKSKTPTKNKNHRHIDSGLFSK